MKFKRTKTKNHKKYKPAEARLFESEVAGEFEVDTVGVASVANVDDDEGGAGGGARGGATAIVVDDVLDDDEMIVVGVDIVVDADATTLLFDDEFRP